MMIFPIYIHEGRYNTPNWTAIMKQISHIGAPDNIVLKDTWFTTDIEKYPSETTSHEPIIDSDNNDKALMLPQSELQVQ